MTISPVLSSIGRSLFVLITLGGLWQLLVTILRIPTFILPSPNAVISALIVHRSILWQQTIITGIEVFLGLGLGIIMGLLSAVILMICPRVKHWLWPILIISQAIPVFALAPILMLWLGYGMASKVLMAALIIFFPITTCCYDGLRQTPQGYLDLAHTLNATRWQTLWRIQLPAALPHFASGLRMAVIFSPIGAVIGEWVGASAGLGYFMLQANAQMHIAELFAAVFILVLFSILLYLITQSLLRHFIPWHTDTVQ